MPSYSKDERHGAVYIRTEEGTFRESKTGREYGGFIGRIAGLSRERGQFTKGPAAGTPVDTLNIHMDVLEAGGEEVRYIISTTFSSGHPGRENPGVFARMILFRLALPENQIKQNDELDIGAYGNDGSKATLASLRRPGVQKALPGFTVPEDKKQDTGWILGAMEKAYSAALNIFGEPKAAPPTMPARDAEDFGSGGYDTSAPPPPEPHKATNDSDLPF